MADEEDGADSVEEVVGLGSPILEALAAENVRVTLHSGKVVEGSLANFSLRKKSKKGSVSWSGKLSVEIDSGVLDMDIGNIASVKAK